MGKMLILTGAPRGLIGNRVRIPDTPRYCKRQDGLQGSACIRGPLECVQEHPVTASLRGGKAQTIVMALSQETCLSDPFVEGRKLQHNLLGRRGCADLY